MFRLIKQLFIVLFSFSESLATICPFLNNEPCMIRPTRINLNPVEFKYYIFIISLDKCTGSCNLQKSYLQKYVPKETKDINVKALI